MAERPLIDIVLYSYSLRRSTCRLARKSGLVNRTSLHISRAHHYCPSFPLSLLAISWLLMSHFTSVKITIAEYLIGLRRLSCFSGGCGAGRGCRCEAWFVVPALPTSIVTRLSTFLSSTTPWFFGATISLCVALSSQLRMCTMIALIRTLLCGISQ